MGDQRRSATVGWNDYIGTSAADDAEVVRTASPASPIWMTSVSIG